MTDESKAIEKFDPSTLMDGVKDRVKATFVALIPDEAWDQMVKKEIDDWMRIRERGYNSREHISDFALVVQNEMKKRAIETVKKIIEEFEVYNWDDQGRKVVHENIQKMILEHADGILLGIVGSMIQQTVNELKSHIQAGII